MPRLTSAFSASTKPFKKFNNYRPLGYNYKIVLPPVLKGRVSNRSEKAQSAYCVEQMSLLMACWKRNNFSQQACSQELTAFNKCVVQAQAAQRAARETAEQGKSVAVGGRYPSAQVNKMLKRFPQPPSTIKLK